MNIDNATPPDDFVQFTHGVFYVTVARALSFFTPDVIHLIVQVFGQNNTMLIMGHDIGRWRNFRFTRESRLAALAPRMQQCPFYAVLLPAKVSELFDNGQVSLHFAVNFRQGTYFNFSTVGLVLGVDRAQEAVVRREMNQIHGSSVVRLNRLTQLQGIGLSISWSFNRLGGTDDRPIWYVHPSVC